MLNRYARPALAAAVGLAFAMLAFAGPAPRAGAAPASVCSPRSGVTVIVDFTHFAGEIERGCAPGHPPTALAALHAAGFTTAGTVQYGDAFVCRIDARPTPESDGCAVTPPANASWSFYSARPTDKAWTYSTTGVTSFHPAAGTIVAFAFGNRAEPGIPPSAAIATPTTTTTTTAPPPTTAAVTRPPVTAPATSPPPTTARVPAATAPPPTTPITTAGAASKVAHESTSTVLPRVVDRTAAGPAPHDGSGSPLPALVAGALVASLGTVGLLIVRARRRRPA